MIQAIIKRQRGLILAFILPLFLLTSCKIMLIGAYDEGTDTGIQKVQKEVLTILVKLETNIDNKQLADNDYKNFAKAYEEVEIDLECLKVRTGALPKYTIVQDQVKLMQANLLLFETSHKLGMTSKKEVQKNKETFEIGFGEMIRLQNGLKRKK